MARQAPGTQALHNPVAPQYTGSELNTAELPLHQPGAIETAEDLADEIVLADPEVLHKAYADELAFMSEMVEVSIGRRAERNPPPFEHVAVNGKHVYFPVEVPVMVPRSYVEVMARARPQSVTTESGESPGDELAFNKVHRVASQAFGITVLRDTPKGLAWLRDVMRQG